MASDGESGNGADFALLCAEQHLFVALKRARQPLAVGVPGECDGCGEHSPRLVECLCAPCREPFPRIPRRL